VAAALITSRSVTPSFQARHAAPLVRGCALRGTALRRALLALSFAYAVI